MRRAVCHFTICIFFDSSGIYHMKYLYYHVKSGTLAMCVSIS